jgi:hypothetical protein
MLRRYEFSLAFWRPDGSKGNKVHLEEFGKRCFPTYIMRGLNDVYSDVWIVGCDSSLEAHYDKEEPHESMSAEISSSLFSFIQVLDGVPIVELESLRNSGYSITGVVNAEIDENQIELLFPGKFLRVLGRLEIDLRVNS